MHKKGQGGGAMWVVIGAILAVVVIFIVMFMIYRGSKRTAGALEELGLVFMWPGLLRQIQQRWRARKEVS